ncbi:hypothetical protein LguiA_008057 [Lonicera macranthoides]
MRKELNCLRETNVNEVERHESKFIQKIVKVIRDKLSRAALDVAPYLIGIHSRVKNINMWLQDGSTHVSVLAICGIGGIGKTTIAKFVYNQNFRSFDGSSFLANIREVSKQPNGLACLQRQLLANISKRKQEKMHNVDEGIVKIKNALCHKRVLLVLDDVDRVDQLYRVLGMQDWLFTGSKIIIITRHERLLKPDMVYKVRKMDNDESVKLFSLHAFGEDYPPESHIEHTRRVVKYCGGLPLALQVLGSSLSTKKKDEWTSALEKLEAIPDSQILEKLKISYDSLQDEHDKRLFLHIACFFVGKDKDYIVKILEKCDFHAKIGIQNLVDSCLLTVEYPNVLMMHHLIQDMGREIIHQESLEPGERRRLWNHEEAFNVLKNETGSKKIEGLILDMHMLKQDVNISKKRGYKEFLDKSSCSNQMTSIKRQCFSFFSGQVVFIDVGSSDEVYLRTNAFKEMKVLRLLQLNYAQIYGRYENFPKNLVWLCWRGFPLKFIPLELPVENLVVFDLSYSKLEQVWKKAKFLGSLKILNLSYSERLARTPNFIGLPNLEILILKGCVSLAAVCESIGNLDVLSLLDLEDCVSLKKLPRNICMLGSLEKLIISGCSNLSEFPEEMRNMESLKVFEADRIVINPSEDTTTWGTKWWHALVWPTVSKPTKGPEVLWAFFPCSLTRLSLSECNLSDDSFPQNFINLPSLYELNLSRNPFRQLPSCIKSLHCQRWRISLKKITPMNETVTHDLKGSHKLVEAEGNFNREPIREVDRKIENVIPLSNIIYELGIFSRFFQGGIVSSLSTKTTRGPSISFTVPSVPNGRIKCLNVCCEYGISANVDVAVTSRPESSNKSNCSRTLISNKIENKTKHLMWINITMSFPIARDTNGDFTLFSQWGFGRQLDAGDEVTVTFDCNDEFEVKGCGFELVYHEQEEGIKTTTEEEKSLHHFPAFQMSTGAYVVFRRFQGDPNEVYWLLG